MANSNSMDEDATGLAVGSAAPEQPLRRSPGAWRKNLIVNYGGALNMGLMAFQQSGVVFRHLHSSPYDVSFDPADYDPAYDGSAHGPDHASSASPTRAGRATSSTSTSTCRSTRASTRAMASATPARPMRSTTASIRRPVPGTPIAASAPRTPRPMRCRLVNAAGWRPNGWTAQFGTYTFLPTDSDLGQGITDFGRFMAWRYVSPTWFNNGSPGGGYVHVPIANVDAAQATRMNTKLGTSQFVTNAADESAVAAAERRPDAARRDAVYDPRLLRTATSAMPRAAVRCRRRRTPAARTSRCC